MIVRRPKQSRDDAQAALVKTQRQTAVDDDVRARINEQVLNESRRVRSLRMSMLEMLGDAFADAATHEENP